MKYAYENGLQIAMFPNKNSLTASINVFVRAGSIYEQPFQSGISHFLEHLMFKGSKKYPGDALSKTAENIGGYINAGTSHENTFYYVNIQKDGVEQTLKTLIDILSDPLIPEDEFLMEKNVVIAEIKRHQDNAPDVFFEEFVREMFAESDLRKSVLGTEETISALKRGDIFDYYHDFYTRDNMVVVISGNFDEKKSEQIILEGISNLRSKAKKIDLHLTETPRPHKDTIKKGRVVLSYLAGGFIVNGSTCDEIYASDIASLILGGNRISRLYKALKNEKQIVHSIHSDICSFDETGLLYFVASFEAKNLEALKDEICRQMELIIKNGVTKEEVELAKTSIKAHWIFSQETPSEIAYNKGSWILRNKESMWDNYVECIEKVKPEDVSNFLKKYYSREFMPLHALLPQ
jgi:predicted Zn-dependent peptidase